jgi:protein-L-isoaspartate O-methyltransferase
LAEFTGERVIPGEVDIDLLNEHMARYTFAARLARGKRVLDAGCGTGYGSAELARAA